MAVYACSDLHGNYRLWERIKNIINENDTVYFLGDAIDRGPDGWKIFKEIIDHPNVFYTCGNHEDMMYNAYKEGFDGYKTYVWFNNGAHPTYEAIMHDPEAFKYLNKIPTMPIYIEYIREDGVKVYMTHSGYTMIDYPGARDQIEREDALWDRTHYHTLNWRGKNNEYIVHGHTPIPYLIEDAGIRAVAGEVPIEPFFYCEGHKIDIDSLTILTDETVLLNLDDFSFIEIAEENN